MSPRRLSAPSLEPEPEQASVTIAVTDPKLVRSFPRNYTAYTITTARDNENSQSQNVVTRRYRDFANLQSALKALHPGVIVPPIPPRALFNYLNEEVIRQRQKGLERFLNRVVKHPKLHNDRVLCAFLTIKELFAEFVRIYFPCLDGEGRKCNPATKIRFVGQIFGRYSADRRSGHCGSVLLFTIVGCSIDRIRAANLETSGLCTFT